MRRNKLNTRLAGCLLLLLAFLSACSHEEGPTPSPDSGLVTLSLQVKTSELPATKGEGEDTEALKNEYIHSLIVLLAKDETIVERWDVKEGKGASRETWASDQISLETGSYVAYAFANMESLPDEGGSFLNTLTETQSISDLETKVVTMFNGTNSYNPETGTYLPMSRRYPFNLTENTTVTIPLVRMLSRVEVSVERDGERQEPISNFSFSGFVDKMNLFVDPYELNDVMEYNEDGKLKTPVDASMVTDGYKKNGTWNGDPFYFYVSETIGDFKINLNLDDTPIGERTLTRTVLVRNRIWPIHLIIKDTQCKFKFEAYNQPIGGAPEYIKPITDEQNNYNLPVKGGGNFTLTLEGVYPTGASSNELTITGWEIEDWESVKNSIYSKSEGKSEGSPLKIAGRIPSKAKDIPMTVVATEENGKKHTFTFNLSATDLFELNQ
ncbi:hypothetical protein [Parabacteroides sp. TM07-1AC]|uniref:hypothetical protein n=1 Tax=Parabacteroides sp. TM07-1AC TaxID=2292363 RepID=UPI000EFE8ADB|nr:hypothetical protein [Parabacteroides sp. TM07-1AC]